MKSPRFEIRVAPLRQIFSPQNLEQVWRKKVRVSMREQFINDGIENFDFHVFRELECRKLSSLILEGDYVPQRAQRILVEKSKGLCRQLVIPSVRDALVLQCLSDALYPDIRQRAPTNRSFFEPKEHRFSTERSSYGTFAAWLNFQRELFNFSKTREFVVVTDIANYYDSISYSHLRNTIASITGVDESVLDMLIYVLSNLLWQPDYMPLVEIGHPQINLDAPRLLAHCFLYDLDSFLGNDRNRDFVRYMDDINVGVDSIPDAKQTLKCIDLILQTKQIRLNSGKTQILSRVDAILFFRVAENARLDLLHARIMRRIKLGHGLSRERRLIELRIRRGLRKRKFDHGNGDKVLKRWINLAALVAASINKNDLLAMIILRPTVREVVYSYIRRTSLNGGKSQALANAAESGYLVDDTGMVDLVNNLVETRVISTRGVHQNIVRILSTCDPTAYFGLYCRLWLQSKYDDLKKLLDTITSSINTWEAHERLGRMVGSFAPLFANSGLEDRYISALSESRNAGARDAYKFHLRLCQDQQVFDAMFPALSNPNPSRGTGITHAKFLCLLSALLNQKVPLVRRQQLKAKNTPAWQDIYYRRIFQRIGV